mmetsp:Transcript_43468/g.139718  ORF Transcript_43468/g.139718 Transcript_43468/m.139718 type:complete len:236 (+) Transcript_43468:206-913(+)
MARCRQALREASLRHCPVRRGNELTVVPLLQRAASVGIRIHALAVLLAVEPRAAELAGSSGLHPGALARAGARLELALVDVAGGPVHLAFALHLPIAPQAAVPAAIREPVGAVAVHLVLGKLANVLGALGCRGEDALPVLEALPVLALVFGAVRPALGAEARLPVVLPLAVVGGSIGLGVDAVPVPVAILPQALEAAAVGFLQKAPAVGHSVAELALVPRAICPAGRALAVHLPV